MATGFGSEFIPHMLRQRYAHVLGLSLEALGRID